MTAKGCLQSRQKRKTLLAQCGQIAMNALWCHLCGNHRLLGKKQSDRGLLYLKCPVCSPDDEVLSKNESIPFLKGIKSFKPAYGHLMEWCHTYGSNLSASDALDPVQSSIEKDGEV